MTNNCDKKLKDALGQATKNRLEYQQSAAEDPDQQIQMLGLQVFPISTESKQVTG